MDPSAVCIKVTVSVCILLNQGEGGGPVSGGLQLPGSGCLSDLRGVLEPWRCEQLRAAILACSSLCPFQLPESSAPEVQWSACSSVPVCKCPLRGVLKIVFFKIFILLIRL